MMEWRQIRLPRDLYNEITKIVEEKKIWINEHDFVREAVREKISKTKEQNGTEA